MPLDAVNEVSKEWFLGPDICDIWISLDVLSLTSSILHLVYIAMDHYWAVTRIDYTQNRSAKRINLMLVLAWVVSVCISILPLFGWKDSENDPDLSGLCIISQDFGYTVYMTIGAFYLPLRFLVFMYLKIGNAAKSRILKSKFKTYNDVKVATVSANSEAPHSTNNVHESSILLSSAPHPWQHTQ